jgi:hypothetical protein
VKAIQQKLDRLDEAFIFARARLILKPTNGNKIDFETN